jgi:acylphosphatase
VRVHRLLQRNSVFIAASVSCALFARAPAPAQQNIIPANITAVSGTATGHVQEVGFRAMIQKQAIKYNLAGHAENVKEAVEFVLQGDEDRINEALDAIENGTKKSGPVIVNHFSIPIKPELKSFTIIRWTSISRGISNPYNLVFHLRPDDSMITKHEAKEVWLAICEHDVASEESGKCTKRKDKDQDDDEEEED